MKSLPESMNQVKINNLEEGEQGNCKLLKIMIMLISKIVNESVGTKDLENKPKRKNNSNQFVENSLPFVKNSF